MKHPTLKFQVVFEYLAVAVALMVIAYALIFGGNIPLSQWLEWASLVNLLVLALAGTAFALLYREIFGVRPAYWRVAVHQVDCI